jgi:hypothetical protein
VVVGGIIKSYTSSICTPTSNTVLIDCKDPSKLSGFYTTSACVPGDSKTVGTDTVTTQCTAFNLPYGYFVASLCSPGDTSTLGVDFRVSPCSVPSPGSFTVGTCIVGSSTSLGRDTQIRICDAAPLGYPSTPVKECESGNAFVLGSNYTYAMDSLAFYTAPGKEKRLCDPGYFCYNPEKDRVPCNQTAGFYCPAGAFKQVKLFFLFSFFLT